MIEERPDQPDLFGEQPYLPYARDSDTSRTAAMELAPVAGELCRRVLAHVRQTGGSTVDEIEEALQMLHQTAGARMRDLVLKGYVKDGGERRNTRSGRKAVVWVVT